jgi:DNA-binding transcriptional LysR family regulator
MRANATDSAPTVSFLMPTPCSAGIFPALLARLNREIGPIVGRGSVKRIDEVAERYVGGEADLALTYRHPSLPRPAGFDELDAIEIGDEPMIPVCAPQRRGQPGYILPVIPGSPLVYLPYGRSSFIGRVVDDEVASRVTEVRPQKLFEDPLIFVLKELALQGIGVAWLPRSTIERNLGDGSLARVGGGDWDIPLTVELLRRKRRLSPAAEAVWTLLATGAATERPQLRSATPAAHRPVRARG